MQLTETAHAKLNLALHVRRRRDDGYHELETLFAFTEAGDTLTAAPSDDIHLTITGPFADGLSAGDDNLVIKAVKALGAAHDVTGGLNLSLEKNLPIAAGIGGGSADAAAALRLAARLWGLEGNAAMDVAAHIGADVPACVLSRTCFGSALGDQLTPVDLSVAGTPVLLVNPRLPCPTGPVFKAWDGVDRGPLTIADWQGARNDLQPPAIALVPQIAEVLDALNDQTGVALVRMSGSGATCFALFDQAVDRDLAAAAIRRARPDWWVLPTALI